MLKISKMKQKHFI